MVASTWTVLFRISISEPKKKTVTRGTPYKVALLKQSIIRSLWEIWHNFVLKNPNLVRPVALERRFRELPQYQISDIEERQSQR